MTSVRVRLHSYDWIVINSSAGKDSQAMLDHVVVECDRVGVSKERIIIIHCDLGRAEWPGTLELAEIQARHYGLRFEVVRREKGGLLECVLERRRRLDAKGKFDAPAWPSPTARFCTSGLKRDPARKMLTRLAAESRLQGRKTRVRILNCLGMRAEESPARAKLLPFRLNREATSGRKTVHDWLPIHSWTTDEVWARIRQAGTPTHPAYALGMPRLSCVLCVLAPRAALMLAGRHNPELLEEYVGVERQVRSRFRLDLSLAEIKEAIERGEAPGPLKGWSG